MSALWSADFEHAVYLVAGNAAAFEDIVDVSDGPDAWGFGVMETGVGMTVAGFAVVPTLAVPTLQNGGSFVAVVDFAGESSFKLSLYSEDFWTFHAQIPSEPQSNGNLTAKDNVQYVIPITAQGLHTFRVTIAPDNVAISIDGGTAINIAPTHTIDFSVIVAEIFGSTVIKSIVCHGVVANEDLPMLSGL